MVFKKKDRGDALFVYSHLPPMNTTCTYSKVTDVLQMESATVFDHWNLRLMLVNFLFLQTKFLIDFPKLKFYTT